MSNFSFKSRAASILSSAYIDLATLEGNAKRLYAGESCTTPFSRDIEKSSWFSTMWTPMKQENSSESTPVWKAHKSADFLMKVLWRATVPGVKVREEFAKKGYQIAFTRYLAHNAAGHVEMQFNDLKGQSFDSVHMDKYANLFTRGYDKWILYNRMVGNTPEVVEFSQKIAGFDIKLPLPFSFTKTPSDALRLCCLKLVDTKFAFHMNNELGRLIRLRRPLGKGKDGTINWEYIPGDVSDYVEFEGKVAKLKNVELWGKYAIVTDEERDFHKSETHSIVLEQSLSYDHTASQVGSGSVNAPFHWNGAVKAIMFGAVNKTAEKYNNYSNYSTNAQNASLGRDPIKTVSLQYDSQYRFQNFPADMFSEVEAMDQPNGTPDVGHHIINYSTDSSSNAPGGATVFDRLMSTISADVVDGADAGGADERDLTTIPNEYNFVMRGISEVVYLLEGNSVKIPLSNDYE